MPHLKELNPKQREAAEHRDGPLLIVAGAGAGKTKTITHRIVNLIKNGIAPEKILAVTFTNKAAKEMRERVMNEIDKHVSKMPFDMEGGVPFVSTFHSLGVYIIKENARILGLTKYFTILDDTDTNSMIKDAIKELSLDPKQYEPRKIKNIISREKGKFTKLSDYIEKANDPTLGGSGTFAKIIAQVWQIYENKKSKENSLDFDDLLLKAVKLLKENEEIKKRYRDRWSHIHIDEYQDTNEVQYLMSKLLTGENRNIAVVGDTDQCLIEGSKVTMSDGTLKNIEDIKKGEYVLSNYGSGDLRKAIVTKTKNLQFKGNLIKIETRKGKIITSTPDHIHFAGYKLGLTPQIYLNYLMYKNGVGWRIGTTSIYTNGQKKSVAGFVQRSNQEHSDKTWVIATYNSENEARVGEYIFSLKYRLPTIPFTPRKGISKNGYVHDIQALKKIFSSFDTKNSALKLLADLGFSKDYPHHLAQASNSNRRNINIRLCGDRRGKTPMHLISIFGNDSLGKKKLESIGLSVRKAKKGTKNWRFETARSDYGEICLLATKIASVFIDSTIIFYARLGGKKTNPRDHNSLRCLPASSIMPGMAMFDANDYDVVSKVSHLPTSKIKVYDIDVEKTHNFIANGIFTHNCIYSWRGANIKNILTFEKDYKDAKIVLLEQNYRSTQNILEAANEVIKKNKYRPDKNLFTKNKVGEKISLYEALDEGDEAEFVAVKILEIADKIQTPSPFGHSPLSGGEEAPPCQGRGWGGSDFPEVAILYRANFQSRVLEEALLRYNIPYQVLGIKFFERKEIKDTLAYLRAALNRESLSDIKRIINFPARGIGKATIAKIFAGEINNLPIKTRLKIENFYHTLDEIKEKIENTPATDVIKFTIKKSGIENELQNGTDEEIERLENIKELATLALKYNNLENGKGIEKLLEDASLASDQDSLMINTTPSPLLGHSPLAGGEKKSVKLMTVHASKGLEFKYVFITGLEDGLFPHEKRGEPSGEANKEDSEEERRLFYVALTRAKEKLFLSFANFRTIFGSRQINTPSEFLADIPRDLLERGDENPNIKTIYI